MKWKKKFINDAHTVAARSQTHTHNNFVIFSFEEKLAFIQKSLEEKILNSDKMGIGWL